MRIFLLTSVYPSINAPQGTTPVVHYFAKEWAIAGHNVHVFHTETLFPKVYYYFARAFKKILDSKLGHLVSTQVPKEYNEIKDGVIVSHITLKKKKPHGRFSHGEIERVFKVISSYMDKDNLPDCFVGHWDNPQLELLYLLKRQFHKPTCLVYHSNRFSYLYRCYGNDTESLVRDIDLVGFRNLTAKMDYEVTFDKPDCSFIAASGVSRPFIEAGLSHKKDIDEVRRFIYVGGLISRKCPVQVIESLHQSYQQEPFEITYIGEGEEKKNIQHRFDELKCKGRITFTGRIPREEVIEYLKKSDVFVMISKGEIFGLVYLEAMALGCITIAARNEGMDGIIEDGVNGFLCDAGNEEELTSIVLRIRQMSLDELHSMSQKAKNTAISYSDSNVAKNYMDELSKLVS